MKSYRKELWFNTKTRRAFVNITPQVEQCLRESGVKEGFVLVNAMHITASVFINDACEALHQDFEKWLDPTFRFHVITFWEVLEHVPDPGELLRSARNLLAPRGLLGVMVPNLDARTNRILHEKSHTFGANHLQYWNVKTLKQQLEHAGFIVEGIYTMISDVNTWWNYLNFQHPYEGGLVHPFFTRAQNEVLEMNEGYKLVAYARKP